MLYFWPTFLLYVSLNTENGLLFAAFYISVKAAKLLENFFVVKKAIANHRNDVHNNNRNSISHR